MTARLKSVLFLLFLISGFCGLLYQVVWMRMAFASFGVITPVLSVIVSVFMAGLFVGSWVAGRWIERLTGRIGLSAIYFYAFSEFAIAMGAWAVPRLFVAGASRLLAAGESNSTAYLAWSSLIIAGAIFPWCAFMGATFPLMTAFMKERDRVDETSFSLLYLANVIGAMLGTLLTAVVLVELLGFRNTLWVAAICNVFIGLVALATGFARPRAASVSLPAQERTFSRSAAPELPALKSRRLLFILFATGFTSMAMEVVWTRAFAVVLRTQVYSFALLLFVYLLATWLGSLLYRRHLANRRVWSTVQLIALLSVSAFLPVAMNDPRFHLRWFGALSSIFPFCALLGYLTPKLIDEYSQGHPDRVGSSYAINILGCILGPLAASYLLLPAMDLKYVLLLLAAPYVALLVVFTFAGEFVPRERRLYGTATLAVCGVSIFFSRTYEESIHASEKEALVRRDHTATVIAFGQGMDKRLLVNGIGITALTTLTKVMGHLPLAMLEEPPQSGLIICFGMGTTWRSLLSWDIDVTAVELAPSVKDVFPYFFDDASALLAKPNGKIVVDDGRRFLCRTNERFDVVTLDPPPPVEAAGSSLLYSDEFYEAVKLRLKPKGILQQWIPGAEEATVKAVARSLLDSFPHVRMFTAYGGRGTHFLASRHPLPNLTAEELVAKMPAAAQADLVEWLDDKDVTEFVRLILSKESEPRTFAGDDIDRITDDRPFNEYYLLRRVRRRLFAR